MKTINIISYKLQRYFKSSKPVIPVISIVIFTAVLYTVIPLYVCSGFVLSGVLMFFIAVYMSANIASCEEIVEEELLLLHGQKENRYYFAREVTNICIIFLYTLLLSFIPVLQDILHQHRVFIRPITEFDIFCGAIIIFSSGIVGNAIGDFLHPRMISNRKLALSITAVFSIIAVVKDGLIEKFSFLKPLGFLIPTIMKPSMDSSKEDFFVLENVIMFFVQMIIYSLVIIIIKNIILRKIRF